MTSERTQEEWGTWMAGLSKMPREAEKGQEGFRWRSQEAARSVGPGSLTSTGSLQ